MSLGRENVACAWEAAETSSGRATIQDDGRRTGESSLSANALRVTPESVLPRLLALESAPITELKDQWRALFDGEPPTSNRRYLETRLGYRIQELAFGGLSDLTLKRLKVLGDALERDRPSARPRDANTPVEGTRLVREWRGHDYAVTVLRNGFEYQGRLYRTLSPIARAITGTRWNGPVFFGLKRNGR